VAARSANALLVGERRGRVTEAKIAQFLTLLQSLPIKLDDETALRAWQEALHLARTHKLRFMTLPIWSLRFGSASPWLHWMTLETGGGGSRCTGIQTTMITYSSNFGHS
jgi:hypothetical protein